jgi:hypothetical protein
MTNLRLVIISLQGIIIISLSVTLGNFQVPYKNRKLQAKRHPASCKGSVWTCGCLLSSVRSESGVHYTQEKLQHWCQVRRLLSPCSCRSGCSSSFVYSHVLCSKYLLSSIKEYSIYTVLANHNWCELKKNFSNFWKLTNLYVSVSICLWPIFLMTFQKGTSKKLKKKKKKKKIYKKNIKTKLTFQYF